MLLHNFKDEFYQVIKKTSEEFGLSELYIEKDYFVSLFLKTLIHMNIEKNIVFKGGTSLSKCYDVIDRFSEDIDLTLKHTHNHAAMSQRKKLKNLIKQTINKLNFKLLNEEETRSRRDYNAYNVQYNKFYKGDDSIVPHIIVETIVSYNPYPTELREVNNYITKYLNNLGAYALLEKYDLQPFVMYVQTIERTFIDKLFAICDYYIDKLDSRNSRHLYDIHMIWSSGMIDNGIVLNIIDDVISDRQLNGVKNFSCMPGENPKQIIEEIIENDFYLKDYNSITALLIHKQVNYKECLESLKEILKLNIIPQFIKNYK